MNGNWEAECMAADPFEGDYGGSGSGDRILSDTMVTARKGGTCHACGGEIRPGTRVRRRAEVYDGDLMRFGWCEDCCKALAVYGENPSILDARMASRATHTDHHEATKMAKDMSAQEFSAQLDKFGNDALAAVDHFKAQRDALLVQNETLVSALRGLELFFDRPNETGSERFDRIAEAFFKATGKMRPGKDDARGLDTDEERRAAFDAWCDGFTERARAALKLAEAK